MDKQVSCDGGVTYVDMGFNDGVINSCLGWNAFDGQPPEPIIVRYVARELTPDDFNTPTGVSDCSLTDSNAGILNMPVTIPAGDLFDGSMACASDADCPMGVCAGGACGAIIELVEVDCSEELDDAEPDTAILVCPCFIQSDPPISLDGVVDHDTASFDCRTPGLEVISDCGEADPDGTITTTVIVQYIGDADLINCQATNELYYDFTVCTGTDCGVFGTGEPVELSPPGPFDLPTGGGPRMLIGTIDSLVGDFCNVVAAFCEIDAGDGTPVLDPATGEPKTITADDCNACFVDWLCPADLTGDGQVEAADLGELLGSWGMCPDPCPPSCPADLNGDCVVEAADLADLLGSWGSCP